MTDELNPVEMEEYLATLLLAMTTRLLREEALAKVEPDWFWNSHLGALWAAARRLRDADKPITRRTLLAEVDVAGTVAIERLLDRVAGVIPAASDFPAAVAEVSRCGRLRRVVQALDRGRQRALLAEDPAQALTYALEDLTKIGEIADEGGPRGYGELLDRFVDSLTSARNSYPIISTPWWQVDEEIAGGLHPGRLYIVGARPGEGKSIIGHNVAHYAAKAGHPALIFSVEMGELEVTGRLVANGADIHMGQIARRRLEQNAWNSLHEYRDTARDWPLFVDDRPDLTLAHVASACRAQKRRTGLAVVVVDYLQLLRSDRTGVSREQQVAHISRTLKQLSRELETAVVVPAQLNRRAVDRDKASLADLRESGGIEADADVVMLLTRGYFPAGHDQAGLPNGAVTVDIAKNRHGRVGSINLAFRGEHARIA